MQNKKQSSKTSKSSEQGCFSPLQSVSITSELEREMLNNVDLKILTMNDTVVQENIISESKILTVSSSKHIKKNRYSVSVSIDQDEVTIDDNNEDAEEEADYEEENANLTDTDKKRQHVKQLFRDVSPENVKNKSTSKSKKGKISDYQLPPNPMYKSSNVKPERSSLRSSVDFSAKKVSRLEHQKDQLYIQLEQKDAELKEKHSQFMEQKNKIFELETDINQLKTENKRLKNKIDQFSQQTKTKLDKYKQTVSILKEGGSMIINQLEKQVKELFNFNISQVIQGLTYSKSYSELDLLKLNLNTSKWDQNMIEEYSSKLFSDNKKKLKKFNDLFSKDVKGGTPQLISDELVKSQYEQIAKLFEEAGKDTPRTNFTEDIQHAFKSVQQTIQLSASQGHMFSSNNKPPRPPSVSHKRNESMHTSSVRKCSSRASFNSESSPNKSILSQIHLNEPLNILEALKQYSLQNSESQQLPDTKFIQEFCTYLFQTSIFKNLDMIIDLLKSEDINTVNEMRKSLNFKEIINDEAYNLSFVNQEDVVNDSDYRISRFVQEENQGIEAHLYDRLEEVKKKCDILLNINQELNEQMEVKQKELVDQSKSYYNLIRNSEQLEGELQDLNEEKQVYVDQFAQIGRAHV